MTDKTRKPRKRSDQATYGTYDDARRNRRDFLRLLARGLLAVPAAGILKGCGVGREKQFETGGVMEVPTDADAEDFRLGGSDGGEPEHDWNISGGAPYDPDLDSPPDKDVHVDPDFVSPGGPMEIEEGPDVQEEDWQLGGIAPAPDAIELQPDAGATKKDVEEDFVLMGDYEEPSP